MSATRRKAPHRSPSTTLPLLLAAVGRLANGASRALALLFCVGLALNYFVVATHENVNWDEFALLLRGAITLDTGVLNGGGRPGLGTVLTMPFVADCANSVSAALAMRWLWGVFSLGAVAAFIVLLRQLLGQRRNVFARRSATHDALLGAALLTLIPLWLRWSVQIRTDQGALFFGLWAAVLLNHSLKRPCVAVLAGVGLVLAALFTQKAAYVVALGGLLCFGTQWLSGDFERKRELRRALWLCAGALLTAVGWKFYVATFEQPPRVSTWKSGQRVFDYYRETLGFQLYEHLFEYLKPHLALVVVGGACALWAKVSRRALRRELALAIFVTALGVCIALFHSAAFAYFWLTIGMFIAAAAVISLGPIRAALPAWVADVASCATWGALIFCVSEPAGRLHDDDNSHQYEALAFVERNFEPSDVGFHPEGALLCRASRNTFRTYFSQAIVREFYGDDAERAAADFVQRFRDEPVMFILDSYRLRQFPASVIRFWSEHYVAATPSVSILGAQIEATSGAVESFEVIVEGDYQWSPSDGRTSLRVNGKSLAAGERVRLPLGEYRLSTGETGAGVFHWAVSDAVPARGLPFFDFVVAAELSGKVY